MTSFVRHFLGLHKLLRMICYPCCKSRSSHNSLGCPSSHCLLFIQKQNKHIQFWKKSLKKSSKMSYYRTCKGVRRMWELNQLRLNKQQSPILSSEVLIGRIIPGRTPYEEASGFRPGNLGLKKPEIEVRVPYYVYDKYYKWFFQHEWDFSVNDPKNLGKVTRFEMLLNVVL